MSVATVDVGARHEIPDSGALGTLVGRLTAMHLGIFLDIQTKSAWVAGSADTQVLVVVLLLLVLVAVKSRRAYAVQPLVPERVVLLQESFLYTGERWPGLYGSLRFSVPAPFLPFLLPAPLSFCYITAALPPPFPTTTAHHQNGSRLSKF